MKKIIALLIAVVLVTGSICVVSAVDEETRITVTALNDYVQVTVNTTEETDALLLKVQSEDNTVFVYAKEKTAPDAVNSDGSYKYNFEFYAGPYVVSGNYKAMVGGISQIETEPFKIILSRDKVAFYNTLDTKAAADIPGYFSTNEFYLPGTYQEFSNIYDGDNVFDLKSLICAEIEAMSLAILPDESNLSAVDSAFTTLYTNRVLCAYVVQEVNSALWDGYVKKLSDRGNVLMAYYSQLNPATIHTYFTTEKEATVTESVIAADIDKAVLLAIADEINAAILCDAIGDYSQNTTVFTGADLTDYNSLDDDNKLLVCEAIKDAEPTTFARFIEVLEEKARELADGDDNPGGGGILGGSPSGGGGGGATVGKETGTTEKTETQKPEIPTVAFTDIGNVSWANTAITTLAQKGVLNGKEANKFYPDDNVTREEFVKIIIEAFGLKDSSALAEFSDVSKDKWSYIYIASAKKAGIVSGNGNGSFGAGDNITRQDMAVILARTLTLAGYDMSATGLEFTDANSISDYAKSAIASLCELGIINGMGDGTYAPKANVTRAQAAKAVYEALVSFENR